MNKFLAVIDKFKHSRVVIIDQFNESGGADYPIRNYLRYLERAGEGVHLIKFMERYGTISLLLSFIFSNKILVNGLRPLKYWRLILFLFFKKKIIVYLHETDWIFRNYKSRNKLKYFVLSLILKNRVVICTSRLHKEFIEKTFETETVHVVYNNIGERFTIPRLDGVVNILMVGSVQERKGVNLFSELADYALEKGETWKFFWLGGGSLDVPSLYFSNNVEWLGKADSTVVHDCIGKSDLFFLSSVDDPFPLSCLEALYQFKRCVVYVNTGTAEIISGISGCAVYSDYAFQDGYLAIKKALSGDLDKDKVAHVNKHISSVSSFAERMKGIF